MLSFIVLGQIPGTNVHLGFYGLVLGIGIVAVVAYGYKLYKTPLLSQPLQKIATEEILAD